MRNWFFSLQLRLILSFTLVLAVTLGSVSLYIGFATQREVDRFQEDFEDARAARIEQIVTQHYTAGQRWAGLQPILERAGSLYSWQIVIKDPVGLTVVDSHLRLSSPRFDVTRRTRAFPVISSGSEVGTVLIGPSDIPAVVPEPSVSRLASAINRSLVWTGLAAGAGGILLISLISRGVLSSARALNLAAGRLGRGDLSQRVASTGRDEIGQLARTFNTMAEGLQDAERQRRNMTADVAHELRTPLSNIQGYVEAVRDGLLMPDGDTLGIILQQVLYLSHLVEDLRLLAETEAGDFRLDRESGSLDSVIRTSVEAIRPRVEAKGIRVDVGVPSELPLFEFDRTRIAQVMGNLLENAIRHTSEGGTVTVSAVVEGSGACVTVNDSGECIPGDALPYVFERFYRADPSRARTTGGAGLGLTIAKQLVEAHGGSIRAESTPGSGSRFVFELPASSE